MRWDYMCKHEMETKHMIWYCNVIFLSYYIYIYIYIVSHEECIIWKATAYKGGSEDASQTMHTRTPLRIYKGGILWSDVEYMVRCGI